MLLNIYILCLYIFRCREVKRLTQCLFKYSSQITIFGGKLNSVVIDNIKQLDNNHSDLIIYLQVL